MKRLHWIILIVAVLLAGRFVAWPDVQKKMLRDQCAKDGGTLDDAGTRCSFGPGLVR